MKKYKKKPIVVEAIQYSPSKAEEVLQFILKDGGHAIEWDGNIIIGTLEGTMKVSPSDFVIKGVKGEFYPCKPDIFFETYEEAED